MLPIPRFIFMDRFFRPLDLATGSLAEPKGTCRRIKNANSNYLATTLNLIIRTLLRVRKSYSKQ